MKTSFNITCAALLVALCAFHTPAAQSQSASNTLERMEKSWVEPDKTEPPGTKYHTFRSATINGAVSYLLYLPPDYAAAKDRRYPVLYWLHGTGGSQSKGGEVVKFLDAAIKAGQAPPMIAVFVNGLRGATMYCDTKDGQWPLESVIIRDLIPHIDATYRTLARRESRAVEGFSMGGFGAAHLGFKHLEVFGVVSILAPALLGPEVKAPLPARQWQAHLAGPMGGDLDYFRANDPFTLAEKNTAALRGRSVIRLVPHDEAEHWLIPRCEQLHAVLDEHRIPHEFDIRRDVQTHNFSLVYRALGERAFGFYHAAFDGKLPATATAAPIAGAAPTRTPSPTRAAPASDSGKSEQLFRRLDQNNDGKIAGEEAASEPGKRFVRMFDKNGDGIVTREEIGGGSSTPPSPPADAAKAKPSAARSESQRGDSTLLQSKSFQSAALKGPVSYTLYLPPGYERDKQRRFPVVFWLHGGGGTPRDCWKFVEVTDAAIKAGECPEFIIIGVDGRGRGTGERMGSQYSDWKDGSLPMETAIIMDLLPHIDATYRTLGTREGRALEGFSMGGHGSLHLAFRHPDLFGAVSALGPALIRPNSGQANVERVYQGGAFQGDEAYWRLHDPLALAEKNAAALKGKMFIRLITGEAEGNFTHRTTIELSEKLKALGIEHDFVRPGETGHNYAKYYEAMPDAPKFYAKAFGKFTAPAKPAAPVPAPPKKSAAGALPAPPVCYDISKSFPGEIGQYRVSRTSRPVEPFEIMDGLYYVGNSQVSAHLLTTTNGLVLLDSTMPHQVPWLLDSIRKLGFDPREVKVVIGGHAHVDHIGGHWYFQQQFGAQTWLHEADAPATQTGAWQPDKPVALDGTLGALSSAFPPFQTDHKLRDGETVEWGGRKFTFHLAAGHTPGTLFTEFPLRDKSSGKILTAGILGGIAPGAAFAQTATKLRAVDVQLWLGAHPEQNKTFDKQRLLHADAKSNPFIDPEGWKSFLDRLGSRGGRPLTKAPSQP